MILCLVQISVLVGDGGNNGVSPDPEQPSEGPPGGPKQESRPWWKFRISKDDLVTYGLAIAISYGVRE